MLARLLLLLRCIITVSLLLAAGLIVCGLVSPPLSPTLVRALVTLAVAVLGASLLWVEVVYSSGGLAVRLGRAGIAFTAAAILLSLVLAWSPFITGGLLWRLWFITTGASVAIAHVLLLLRARRTPLVTLVRNITLAGVIGFAAIVLAMAFRADVFALPGPVLAAGLYGTGALNVLGSAVLLGIGRPGLVQAPWSALRASRWIALPLAVFGAGFYLGRITAPSQGILESGLGSMAGLPPDAVAAQVASDLGRLQAITRGLVSDTAKAETLRVELLGRLAAEGRSVYSPDEDDAIRSLFFGYLSYRTALLRMVAYYQGFDGLSDPALRAQCFLVGYAAGAICFDASLRLVSTYRTDPMARAKLNEPVSAWGIPAGMFDRIEESVSLQKHLELFEEMTAYFETHRDRWRACGLPASDTAWLQGAIESSTASVKTNPRYGKGLPLARILEKVQADAYSPVYAVQSLVSTWIGDTRLVSREPCISAQQVEEMRVKLEPGDIILERRNWFLSNAFLPGFWPHAALYTGTAEDLERLGISDEPIVRDRLAAFTAPAHDGGRRCVIESISEGVSFSSLGEAARADYIAVLRPRVSKEERARAIVKAFSHQGKPYDFEFDFFSADKLVCTELVYRSYEGVLKFELVKIMGRMTLPAVEIARKFAKEAPSPERQLDFVLFLDTLPGGETAAFRDAAEFRASAERPRAFNE